jgi:hypothetical protein
MKSSIRELIERTIVDSIENHSVYEKEIQELNEVLKLKTDSPRQLQPTLPPKYITGDPDEVHPGEYMLVVSLNHHYNKSKSALREYANLFKKESHISVTLDYFKQKNLKLAKFFKRLVPVIRVFAKKTNKTLEDIYLLRTMSLFVEYIPLFSQRFKLKVSDQNIFSGYNVIKKNIELQKLLLKKHPPAAMLFNGKATHLIAEKMLTDCGLVRLGQEEALLLAATTRAKANKGKVIVWRSKWGKSDSDKNNIIVVRSNFVGSQRNAPNSIEQREELGRLLAGK